MFQYGFSSQWFKLDCMNPGSRVRFPTASVLLFLSELQFADQLITHPPFFRVYFWLISFCYFSWTLVVFALFLFDFWLVKLFLFFTSFIFPLFEIVELFSSINKCKRGKPTVRFIGPLKCLGNTCEPPKDFFCPFIFCEYI